MKVFIIISSLLLSSLTIWGQNELIILSSFGKGDIETISTHFAKNVEICIGDEVDYYPRNEAKKVLSDFFTKVRPINCSSLHKGASADKSSKYLIGKLITNKGTYRLFVFVKKTKSKQLLIKEVRLESF